MLWAAISGLGIFFNINTVSLRQQIVPNHLLGRVISIAGVLAWSAIPVGALAGGWAVERTGSVALVYGVIGSWSPCSRSPFLRPARPRRPLPAGRRTRSALVGGGGDEVDVAVLGQQVEVVAAVGEGHPLDVGHARARAGELDRPGRGRLIRSATSSAPARDGSAAW